MPINGVTRARCGARLLAFALAQTLVAGQALAASDDDRIGDLERKLEQSTKLIQQLSERVERFEGAPHPAAKPAASAASEPLAVKVRELEQQVSAMANPPAVEHGLDIHGFADVGFAAASPGRPSGANIGALDFYLTPNFTDRVKSLFELNFECCDEGHVGVDLERLQIGYAFSDALTLWAGRFHTPFGYWNTAFHHGAQLQTAIARPKFLDFEDAGGILPVHTVGLWATGSSRGSAGRLGYDFYAGNAPTIQIADPATAGTGTLDPGLAGAGARAATLGLNLNYAFTSAADGLRVGVHALSSKVVDTASNVDSTRLTMFGAWLAYLSDDWEVLAEEYNFRNRDLSGGSGNHTSNAAYVQVGHSLRTWTPYARYEWASLDQTDAYFAQQESGQSYKRLVAGLRYDLNPRTALKLEVTRTRLADRDSASYSELRGQLAVRF